MAKSGVIDEITAHRALESLPEVWAELAHGRIGREEALERGRLLEPEELVERTTRMLTPPTAAEAQARLGALLGSFSPPKAKPRVRPWLHGGVVAVAAAAAVLLLVMPREPSDHPVGVGGASELRPFDADYELEILGGLALERSVGAGAEGEVPSFRVNGSVDWSLRPGSRVTDAVGVRAFASRVDGHTITLKIGSQVDPSGVVKIFGRLDAWGLEPGRWQLTFVVGPSAGLPDAVSDVRMDEGAPYDVEQKWIEVLGPAAEEP